MNIAVTRSRFWWEPFLRVAGNLPDFKRFLLSRPPNEYEESPEELERRISEYKKYVLDQLLQGNGMFFFASEDLPTSIVGATAASVTADTLTIHFYWSSKRGMEANALFCKTICDLHLHYSHFSSTYVCFPVPKSWDSARWRKYSKPIPDEYGRNLVWYKFFYEDFMRLTGVTSEMDKVA